MPTAQTNGYFKSSFCSSFTSAADAGCKPTEALARAATDCKPIADGGLGTANPAIFNMGMEVEAYFEGAVGFNFEIMSDVRLAHPLARTTPNIGAHSITLVLPSKP